jgi:hypothetical protein
MDTHRYTAGLRLVVAGIALHAVPLPAQSSFAQAQFAWPDTTVDVGRYATVDECLAATHRVWDGIRYAAWAPVWHDTLPDDGQRRLAPLPPSVTQAAQRCAARFDARTAGLGDFAPLAKLYLQAGRDAEVSVLLARRLRELGAPRAAERAMVVDTVFHLYLDAQPVRLAAAESLLHRPEWAARDKFARLEAYIWLAAGALVAGDTVRAQRVGGELLARMDSLTPAERSSPAFQASGAQKAVYLFYLLTTKEQLLDSLRQSTAAYVRTMRGLWAKFTGKPPETLPVIGQRAAPIVGDYWVPAEAGRHPRPAPGQVALIVFGSQPSCFNYFARTVNQGDLSAEQGNGGCFADAAALHRLAQRFPALEITIATRTGVNVFGYLPPQSPAATAEWLERAAAAWKFPGALAIVAQTPAVRIPAPDDRIVESSLDSNLVHYHFGDGHEREPLRTAFLVDPDGIIVWQVDAGIGFGETRDILRSAWLPMIDVLLHRGKAEATAGAPVPSTGHF